MPHPLWIEGEKGRGRERGREGGREEGIRDWRESDGMEREHSTCKYPDDKRCQAIGALSLHFKQFRILLDE
jgi:hypothetical protein